ncbi:hypothetical protein, partial [Lonsdalea populi]
ASPLSRASAAIRKRQKLAEFFCCGTIVPSYYRAGCDLATGKRAVIARPAGSNEGKRTSVCRRSVTIDPRA